MYIYCITNLINFKKYIGKTIKQYPTDRWSQHKYEVKNNSNCYLHNSIRKYGFNNFSFCIIDSTATSIDELNELEIFYINDFDTFNGDGYNLTIGGEGTNNIIVSEETRKKQSQAKKGKYVGENNPFYGKTHSEETKKKCGEKNIGNKYSVGRKHTEETKEKNRIAHEIRVSQYKKDETFIRTFRSAKYAEKITGIFAVNIAAVCKKKKNRKSAGGFIWRYTNETNRS